MDDLPGKQYTPSNGTEGCAFFESWCSRCERDKAMNGTDPDASDDDLCPIIAVSYSSGAPEWRELPDGKTLCTAFVPMGQSVTQRCERTADMFGEG